MDPQLTAAVTAVLFGAAKIGLIGTVGYATAWIRAETRIEGLENSAAQRVGAGVHERIDRIEQTVDYMASQLDRPVEAGGKMRQQLSPRRQDVSFAPVWYEIAKAGDASRWVERALSDLSCSPAPPSLASRSAAHRFVVSAHWSQS